jgi:hypothetical protein
MKSTLEIIAVAAIAAAGLAATECRVNTGPTQIEDEVVPVVVGDPFDVASWVEDPYTIRDARVSGDQLVIDLRFSGGCEDHDFRLVRAEAFLESNPVQQRLLLAHDGHDDACEALLQPTLTIDITSIRNAWRQAYQQTSGTIILRLHDWDGELRYEF